MSDPIREREHREEHADGWHWWRCVPVIDAPAPLELARLRAIEEAARAAVAPDCCCHVCKCDRHNALRAALEGAPHE